MTGKVPFSLIVFIGYVWTEAVSVKKKLRFQMKTDTCGLGLRIEVCQNAVFSKIDITMTIIN